MSNQNNPLVRFIGKVQKRFFKSKTTGEDFSKVSILLDNPYAQDAEGNPNKYYKGHLSWYDAKTNQHFLVKQVELSNVSEQAAANGFTNSLKLNLGDEYHVQKIG